VEAQPCRKRLPKIRVSRTLVNPMTALLEEALLANPIIAPEYGQTGYKLHTMELLAFPKNNTLHLRFVYRALGYSHHP
jgi:hypothetical protein